MDPQATDILAQTAEQYGSLSSYEETTAVVERKEDYETRELISEERRVQKILFIRPSFFRVEIESPARGDRRKISEKQTYVVNSTPEAGAAWWIPIPKRRSFGSMAEAFPGLQGVTGGTALIVPQFLLPREPGSAYFVPMDQAIHTGVEELGEDNEPCARIQVETSQRRQRVLWVSTATFLIRRIWILYESSAEESLETLKNALGHYRRAGYPVQANALEQHLRKMEERGEMPPASRRSYDARVEARQNGPISTDVFRFPETE